MMEASGVLRVSPPRMPHTSLEDPVWRCPCCGKEFQRRFVSPGELQALFGSSSRLKVEIGGPDARREHLETHTTGGERRKPPHVPRGKYPPRARNNIQRHVAYLWSAAYNLLRLANLEAVKAAA
jgi:hypothetical protein